MNPAKALVVTGAGGGLGSATVAALARRGARVLAIDLDAEAVALAAEAADGDVATHTADVSDDTAVRGVIAAAVERLARLDGIFNNAATLGPTAPVVEYETEVFERVFRVNVLSVFLGMKHAIGRSARRAGVPC